MGDAQMRAAFDFSGLGGPLHQRRPRSETSVTHLRELWVVRKIEEDGVGPLITCKRPQPEASSRAEPTHFFVVLSDEHVAPEIELSSGASHATGSSQRSAWVPRSVGANRSLVGRSAKARGGRGFRLAITDAGLERAHGLPRLALGSRGNEIRAARVSSRKNPPSPWRWRA